MKRLITILLSFTLISTALGEEEQTQLGKHMDELNIQLKSLRKFDDEDWSGKAGAAQKAQEELMKCFPLIPALTEKTEDMAEKAQQIAYYKQLLAENLALLYKLEIAFYKEDEDLADDILSELKSIKKKGHTTFIEEN